MSSPMKLSLLALVSTAVAVPHYGQHSKYHHKPSGAYGTGSAPGRPAYPTGGWWGSNSTGIAQPTGTGAGVPVPNDQTTTLLETLYSTQTIVSTIYATRPAGGEGYPESVGAADVSTGAAACGPETVYVTATNKVTVTVGGGAPPASSAEAVPVPSEPAVSSEQPAVSTPVYEAPAVSSVVESQISYPQKEVEQPTGEDVDSVLPVTSAQPVETSAPAPTSEVVVSTPAETPTAASSSAAPKPSGGASYSGTKRGLVYNEAELCSAFDGGKFGWAYNWDKTQNGDLPEGVNFFPTCHRPALYDTEEKAQTWFDAVDEAVKSGSTAVIGFNEPDEESQFPIDVDTACKAWIRLMNPVKESHPDLNVISLSVTNGGEDHKGLKYLRSFVDSCTEAKFDAINIHFYDIYDEGTVERFTAHVDSAAEQFGLPVWVTEFQLNPGSATAEQAAKFLEGALEYLDSAEHVAGYSYFKVGDGENQLIANGGLSDTGKVYAEAS